MKAADREMNIHLTPELEALVRAEVASGAYASDSEVVSAALRERYARRKLDEIADAARRGDADIDAGRCMDAEQAFAHIRRELGLSDPSDVN